ncbi:MAG: nucleotide sugar dehydrogenase [Candidatus Omnitrophota bacterium]
MDIIEKIKTKKATCAVIGMGYVGLPLAVEFALAGFKVIAIDLQRWKVDAINKGKSYIDDVESSLLKSIIADGRLSATTDYHALKRVDTINICVPTPLRKTKEPDISYIVYATEKIAKYLSKGQLVILESTTYPGTTEEVMLPIFEKSGLKAGTDFWLAFSPERVDPSNKKYTTKNIPKVVGGITKKCTKIATLFYEQSVDAVIPVESTRVAEAVKLLENTFRSVNIGLVNEIALMCHKMGINVWEVIDAAATKPFGFMKFYPGPGLGGHCIPIDPQYLSWKARMFGFEARFIDLAAEINRSMPEHVVGRIIDILNDREKSLKKAKILILGVAYKKDVSDYRESPALEIIEQLIKKGADVFYSDPHVPEIEFNSLCFKNTKLSAALLRKTDCAVIVTDHSLFDYSFIIENSPLIFDTRNALKNISDKKIVKL